MHFNEFDLGWLQETTAQITLVVSFQDFLYQNKQLKYAFLTGPRLKIREVGLSKIIRVF